MGLAWRLRCRLPCPGTGVHTPPMAEAALLGRTDELVGVEAALEVVATGPACVLLVGEAGIGKSAIWTAAVERARDRGDRIVLAARAVATEGDLAHVVLADLLTPVAADVLPTLPAPQAAGLAAALLLERPERPVDPRLVGTATLAVLERLAAGRAVLIAIDDLPWIDPASVDALGFALRRAWDRGLRVGILATLREGPGDDRSSWVRDLPLTPTRIEVGPVTLGVLHHLLRDRVGATLSRPQLVRLEGASLGNPLLAMELARAIERRGRWPGPGEPLPVPDDIERLVADRLEGLPATDRRVLFVLAVASTPTTAVVSAVLDNPPSEVVAATERATAAGLLEATATVGEAPVVRFAHPLFAAAAIAALPVGDARSIHGRLADLVADDEDRGRHAARAASGPDRRTAERVEAAALAARRRGAPSVAAELAEAAAALTPPGDGADATRRRILAARWLGEVGAIGRARTILDEAMAEMPAGDARAEAGELAAQMAGWVEGSEALLRRADAALEDARDPKIRARLLLRIAGQQDVIGTTEALRRIDEAIALLRASDAATSDPDLLACALLQSASARYHLGTADDAAMVEEAIGLLADEPRPGRDGADRPEGGRAHQLAWVWHVDHDRFDLALPGLLAELERTIRTGHDRPRAIAEADAAQLHAWMGDLDAAERHARAAMEAAELADHPQSRSAGLSALAAVAVSRGRLDDAEAAARAGLATFGDGFLADRHRAILGSVALVRGDAAAAVAILGGVLDEQLARDGREAPDVRLGGDLVEAAVAAGDLDRAEAVLDLQAQTLATTPRPWLRVVTHRGRALLEAARGDLDSADAAIGQALAAADGLGMPIERGRTRLVAGRIARRRKDRRRAGEHLDAAATTFEAVGALAWLAITRAEAARLGRRSVGHPDALTETEDQVARLAASGRTNREVAEAAFLTPKSVEGVLSRVYQKLGIRSRAELGAWLAGGAGSRDRETPVSMED
jgi:DNA-binding CsgD family transcriptional regulator